MEKINNPVYENDRVRISVVTNGCTSSSDFVVEHIINSSRCELTVVRAKRDFCRKASSVIDLELAWTMPSDCIGMDVVFLNPEIGRFEQHFERQIEIVKPAE